MKRTNSSAFATRPSERRAATSMSTAATGTATQNATPTGRARRQEQRRRGVVASGGHHRGGQRTSAFGGVGISRVLPDLHRVEGCPDPCGLVADAHEHPHQEEGSVEGPVGLGQRADRQVVLVRARVDAEPVPGQRDPDEHQPGRDAAERRPRTAPVDPRPRVAHRFEMPAEWATRLPAPQRDVDEEHRPEGDAPRDLRGRRRPVEAAHPTAPGAQRDAGNADDHAAGTHGHRSIPGGRDAVAVLRSLFRHGKGPVPSR